MKKWIVIGVVVALVIALVSTLVVSASSGQPSAKATAQVGNINWLDLEEHPEATILSNVIKTPNQKDLFIDVSLESGLYTQTLVKSKLGTWDTSMARAVIEVRVLLDKGTDNQREAYPGWVVFASREQTLSAKFQGMILPCLTVDPDTHEIIVDPECVEPEELELILDTMNANSFNFILDDVPQGTHTISVIAMIHTTGSVQEASFTANATIGKGSVTVEEVRMIKGEDILLP